VDVMTGNIGTNIQGYRPVEPLGPVKGCNVFKAVSTQGDEIVAIKFYPVEISRNRPLLERLRKSFQFVAQLHHPNILPIKSSSVQAGRPYIVMPFMESGSLQDRIDCGALAAINVEAVISGLVSALEWTHSKGMVHGNLKPSSILFDEEGNVQLNGLGEVVLKRSLAYQNKPVQDGPLDYRAPEVKAGGEITPLSDQYSLALIALQMLTNLPIDVALTTLDMFKSQGSDQTSRPSPFTLNLPKRMIAVLLQALSGDPSQRFPSVRVMYQAFIAALHNEDFRLEPQPESKPKPKPEIPIKRKRSRLLVFAPILAVVIILLVAIPALSSGGDGPFSGLIALLGMNNEGNVAEVVPTDSEVVGGLSLGTESAGGKSTSIGDVSIKGTGIVATAKVSEAAGGTTDDPINTPVPPGKTDPPKQPAATQSSPEQPTATFTPTPTPTITETEAIDVTPTITEASPTDVPSEAPINPNACKDDPNHPNYCTPTPPS
jgi:serine/threonine protein kinase